MDQLTDSERFTYYTGEWLRLPFEGYPSCPCGRESCYGQKIARKTGHVVGCDCPRCRGSQSNAKGRRGQDLTHKALGGSGPARRHEESQKPYVVEVTVMPESKEGDQIPASLVAFLESEWYRHALSQAERGAPIGSHVVPAVSIAHRWLVVDMRPENRPTVLPHSTRRRV